MSTYQIRAMADRVVMIHETEDGTMFSEFDVDQADILLQQLEAAVRSSVQALRSSPNLEIRAFD